MSKAWKGSLPFQNMPIYEVGAATKINSKSK
jgi:hypothetical protein